MGYSDVIEKTEQLVNPYFKLSGVCVASGKRYGMSHIKLINKRKNNNYEYTEIEGVIESEELDDIIREHNITIKETKDKKENIKEVHGVDFEELKQDMQKEGVYCYFPADRNEFPHWMNIEPMSREKQFKESKRIAGFLEKPIIVRRSLQENIDWIARVFMNIGADTTKTIYTNNRTGKRVIKSSTPPYHDYYALNISHPSIHMHEYLMKVITHIFQKEATILTSSEAGNLSIYDRETGQQLIKSLDALSAGESSLFNIFVTILRYGTNNYNSIPCEGYVFPSQRTAKYYAGTASFWERAKKSKKIPKVRVHDLRHTFASVAAEASVNPHIIGALLWS